MARITVEDCLTKQTNRFALIHLASKRTKQLLQGATVVLGEECDNKAVVTSLREIAEGKVRFLTAEEAEHLRELNLEEQVPGLEPEAVERRALAQKSFEEELSSSSDGEGLGELGAKEKNGASKNGHSLADVDVADDIEDDDDVDDEVDASEDEDADSERSAAGEAVNDDGDSDEGSDTDENSVADSANSSELASDDSATESDATTSSEDEAPASEEGDEEKNPF